ncbi:DUF2974 domain-containing protein [Bifidobacterium oedipodis]|uniref:Uncharacterized protein n=1 Tax=Bifidobacterium oedipodis TaxID=2675322 RepID=A0A7Y0EQD5_9BIFI|nr:DUF2974 domain-containing protein [Bifidobacterium sp. DSM 109957]NMM94514.1 hypothetical protein [Bifidobacterium sp. DSM 109957]
MANIIDYVREETRSLRDLPFNEVDALVLATLVYEDVARISPKLALDEARTDSFTDSFVTRIRVFEPKHPWIAFRRLWHPTFESVSLEEANLELHRSLDTEDDDKPHDAQIVSFVDGSATHMLFQVAGESPRFSSMRLGAVVEHVNPGEQTQFAAVTFQLPDGPRAKDPTYQGTLVISLRGTDDSLIGWKEDFNMTFQYPVPAQRAASAYLDTVARLWKGPIVLVGHSKGGNLAIYAAMNADEKVRRRIRHVYSLDGPGFPPQVVTSPEYQAILPKVTKIVPDSSIVGMIFETPEPCRVVASDSDGLMQHNAFTWQIEGDDFLTEPSLSSSSQLFNEELNRWIANLTPGQRERAVDALFKVLHANGAASVHDVMSNLPASIPSMLGAYVGLTAEDRRNIAAALGILFKAATARTKRSSSSDIGYTVQ